MPETASAGRLRSVPLFADLAEPALDRVAGLVTEVEFPAGTVLIEADSPGSGLFVILDGRVRVELPQRTVACDSGEFVGELSLLTDHVDRSARVIAETDVRCLAIGRVDFLELIEDEPRIAVPMLSVLARRLLRADAPDA